jgi:chemotaxis protein methyltransferase CheR
MDKRIFDQFRTIIYQTSGIALNEKKESLVAARIGKRMRALGIQSHKEYLEIVKSNETGEEIAEMLDAISTNVTSFFREQTHFQFVETVFKNWLDQGQKIFRFWSAASSTGEEPYTLAMVIKEAMADHKVDIKILGTDINTKVIQTCRKGSI